LLCSVAVIDGRGLWTCSFWADRSINLNRKRNFWRSLYLIWVIITLFGLAFGGKNSPTDYTSDLFNCEVCEWYSTASASKTSLSLHPNTVHVSRERAISKHQIRLSDSFSRIETSMTTKRISLSSIVCADCGRHYNKELCIALLCSSGGDVIRLALGLLNGNQ
jgi:hypothetical protein